MRVAAPRPRAHLLGDPRALESAFLAALDRELDLPRTAIPNLFVVAPTRRLCDHLAIVATRRRGALAGVRFLVHKGLARHLLEEAGAPAGRELAPSFLQALFRSRLAPIDSERARYLHEQPAALGPLLSTFRDLRDAEVEATAAARVAGLSSGARATLALFRDFEQMVVELAELGFVDGATAARRAHKLAATARCDALLHYGAYELIGVHRELVAALAARTTTELFIPFPIAARAPTELAAALRAEVVAESPLKELPRATALTSAAGRREELRFALRRLLQWHHQDQVPFEEMAVLTRSADAYAVALAAEAALLDLEPDHSLRIALKTDPHAVALRIELEAWRQPENRRAAERAKRASPLSSATRAALGQRFTAARSLSARLAVVQSLAGELDSKPLAALLADTEAMAAELEAGGWLADGVTNGADGAAALVDALLDETRTSAEPDAIGGLCVLDFQQARALPFRRAVIVGANEELLPHRAAEDFFLPDADRVRLAGELGRPVPIRRDAVQDEKLLFAVVRSGVSERLEATFARADGERDLAPSPWLRDLTDTPAKRALLIPRHPAREIELLATTTGLLRREEALITAAHVSAASARRLAEHRASDDLPTWLRGASMVAAIDDYGDAPLHWDASGVAVPAKTHWTPSQLESLGRCPLRYFFDHELGLVAPPDPPDGELSRRDLGRLFHEVLRDLYRELFDGPGEREGRGLRADALSHARQRLPALLSAVLARIDERRTLAPFLTPIRIAQWSDQLAEFVADDVARLRERGCTGGDFELADQVELDVAGTKVTLKLRYDRVVRDGAGRAWIGDYKLRRHSALKDAASVAAAVKGRELQLPLYGRARAGREKEIAGLELLALAPERDGTKESEKGRAVALDLEALRERDGELQATLKTLLELRAAGSFPLQPDNELEHGQCGSCDWRRACRHAHGATRERVAAASQNRDYFRLTEKKKP